MDPLFKKESHGWIATKRLWLTAKNEAIVHDGDHRAASLLAPEGGVIALRTAKALKLDTLKVLPFEEAPARATVNNKSGAGGFVPVSPEEIKSRRNRVEHPERER